MMTNESILYINEIIYQNMSNLYWLQKRNVINIITNNPSNIRYRKIIRPYFFEGSVYIDKYLTVLKTYSKDILHTR